MERPESDDIAIISGSTSPGTSADGQQDAVQNRQLENFIKVPPGIIFLLSFRVSRMFSYSSKIFCIS